MSNITYQCAWPSGIGYMPTSSPCGPINATDPVVSCCADGDYCLTDNICAYTSHSDDGGSGYYSAGCSNATVLADGSSSACSNRCSDTGLADVVYDSSDGSWKCCGGTESERDCQSPTNETFVGAAPSDLITIWLAGSTTTTASTSTSTASTSTSTTTSASSLSTSTSASASATSTPGTVGTGNTSQLSVGAKAGIGIGVSVGVIGLVALIAVFIHRRRRNRNFTTEYMTQKPTGGNETSESKTLSELPTRSQKPQELPLTKPALAELY